MSIFTTWRDKVTGSVAGAIESTTGIAITPSDATAYYNGVIDKANQGVAPSATTQSAPSFFNTQTMIIIGVAILVLIFMVRKK